MRLKNTWMNKWTKGNLMKLFRKTIKGKFSVITGVFLLVIAINPALTIFNGVITGVVQDGQYTRVRGEDPVYYAYITQQMIVLVVLVFISLKLFKEFKGQKDE